MTAGETKLSAEFFSYKNFEIRFYNPKEVDLQVSHVADEIYFVVSGSAILETETSHKKMYHK